MSSSKLPPTLSPKLDLHRIITEKVRSALGTNATSSSPNSEPSVKSLLESAKAKGKQLLTEALILMPKSFVLKTEFLSSTTKENHFKLYKSYVDSFNNISARLDSASRTDAENPNNSEFRRLKLDEQANLNAAKLHELYFNNISDVHSEIRMDSVPYMRLSRDWGTFEAWQFDFRACAMAATEGWAVVYWEPMKQRYVNVVIEGHTNNIPVMGVPVLVIDTFHHAWFRDHPGDKMNYVNAMMREINWNLVEARMAVAEMCNLHQIYMLEPVNNVDTSDKVRLSVSNEPPIAKDQVVDKIKVG